MRKVWSAFACALAILLAMGCLAGCEQKYNGEKYNKGYEMMYAYITENNTSTTLGVIQASGHDLQNNFYIFTMAEKKGSSISICISGRSKNMLESLEFELESSGFSSESPLVMELITEKVGSYYYKAETQVRTASQTSFTFYNHAHCTSIRGTYTPVPAVLITSLDSLLELAFALTLGTLQSYVESTVNVNFDMFDENIELGEKK